MHRDVHNEHAEAEVVRALTLSHVLMDMHTWLLLQRALPSHTHLNTYSVPVNHTAKRGGEPS